MFKFESLLKPFEGIVGILQSRKGTISLIILGLASTSNVLGHLDSVSYAAVIATISGIFCWTSHKCDLEAIKSQK